MQKSNFDFQQYDVPLHKNDENDSFDERVLLQHVPEKDKQHAKTLIQFFNKYPEQITWNKEGTIFIDQVSIPDSNIYRIFHCLFDHSKDALKSNSFPKFGFEELFCKIKDMKLDYLISSNFKPKINQSYSGETVDEFPDIESDNSSDIPWWFLG